MKIAQPSELGGRLSLDIPEPTPPEFRKPLVVNVKTHECTDYIGRAMPGRVGSQWANAFKVTKDTPALRAEAVNQYVRALLASELRQHLHTLRGGVLGCWCAPKLCHGDALAALVMQQRVYGLPCQHCAQPLKSYLNLWGTTLYESAICLNCNARGYYWRSLPVCLEDGRLAMVPAMG